MFTPILRMIPQHIPIKTLAKKQKKTQVLAGEAKFAFLFIVASETFCNGPFNNSHAHTLTGNNYTLSGKIFAKF